MVDQLPAPGEPPATMYVKMTETALGNKGGGHQTETFAEGETYEVPVDLGTVFCGNPPTGMAVANEVKKPRAKKVEKAPAENKADPPETAGDKIDGGAASARTRKSGTRKSGKK